VKEGEGGPIVGQLIVEILVTTDPSSKWRKKSYTSTGAGWWSNSDRESECPFNEYALEMLQNIVSWITEKLRSISLAL